jgi:hypothetical protein
VLLHTAPAGWTRQRNAPCARKGVRPIGRQRRHCRARPGRRSRYSLPRRRPRRATGSARKFAQGNLGQAHAGQAHARQAHARQAHAGQYRAPPAADFRAAHPRLDRHARPPDRCRLPRPDPLPRRRAEGAFVFAADLARQLATPSTTDFISASSGIPDPDQAIVEDRKIIHYLLSSTHTAGRAKALFFRGFGLRASAGQRLRDALLDHARSADIVSVRSERSITWKDH